MKKHTKSLEDKNLLIEGLKVKYSFKENNVMMNVVVKVKNRLFESR